jgi:glycosyltransferase involved in cell wall biosynthesis
MNMSKKLLVVTDTWEPYFNGVITTLRETARNLERSHNTYTRIVHPRLTDLHTNKPFFKYIPLKELDMTYSKFKNLERIMIEDCPDFIHIETEGPLGIAARHYCLKYGWKFTTAYHTKHPEYLKVRYGIPLNIGYNIVRWFHKPSSCVMAATDTLINELKEHGFENKFGIWSRGVDTTFFTPALRSPNFGEELKPYALYVGRVAKEKNIEDFLKATTSLKKVIVGDGPARIELEKKYPTAIFLGKKSGHELADIYANAEIFVFPSVEDTFGVVLIEALASGLPIAATPVSKHVVSRDNEKPVAALYYNMNIAIVTAQHLIDKDEPRKFVLKFYTPEVAARQFFENLELIDFLA